MGVVLKHTQSEGYVATYPQATGQPLFAIEGLFPKRPDGKPRLPSQLRLEAIYYTSRPDETAFPKESLGYTRTFHACGNGRGHHPIAPDRGYSRQSPRPCAVHEG